METFSALLALCAGNSPVTGEFPAQRPVIHSFDVFVDLRMNKRLNKWPRRRWFETPSRLLWRHCNEDMLAVTWHGNNYYYYPFLIHSCTIYGVSCISDIANCICTHNNITCERCIEVAILVCGWCQAITSKSKYQRRVFPLCFPNIPYLFNIVYILYGCLAGDNGMFAPVPVNNPGPLFTKRMDVLPPNIVKSRSREIDCYDDHIVLKFDRHIGSAAADMPVKFQSDWNSLNPNLAPSRLHEIRWMNRGPEGYCQQNTWWRGSCL